MTGALCLIGLYLLPFWIAVARGLDAPWLFLFGNLFGGITFFGWFLVLYIALTTPAPGHLAARAPATRPVQHIYLQHSTWIDAPTYVAQAIQVNLEAGASPAAPGHVRTLRALPADRWSARA